MYLFIDGTVALLLKILRGLRDANWNFINCEVIQFRIYCTHALFRSQAN